MYSSDSHWEEAAVEATLSVSEPGSVGVSPRRPTPRAASPIVADACSPRKQDLIILPTEQCNFRCTYCYEDFAVGKMKDGVQRSIERFMNVRVPELRQLSIKWFGGEPLVAKDVVLRLAAHAKRLCDEHQVDLRGGLTTNAWLLKFDLFEQLVAYDQRFFQITLDGWGEDHDAVRRRANGRGTFERIWSNLLATRDSKMAFEIQIRIHVRRGQEENLKVLLTEIARDFGHDQRFTLDFEHLRNLGGEGGMSVVAPLSLKELKVVEKGLRAFYESQVRHFHALGRHNDVLEMLDAIPQGEPYRTLDEISSYVCYASKPNSLLIRADGRIGKCTVALTDSRNTIGRINDDGSVNIDATKLRPWIRGIASLDETELSCPLVGLGQT